LSVHSQTWNVCVVGGGVVGLSAALELQSRGFKVIVIDRGRPRERASFGNAGVIGAGSVLTPAGPGVWRNLARYAANRDPALRIRYRSLPSTGRWLLHFLANCTEEAWRRSAKALSPLTAIAYDNHMRLAHFVGAVALMRRTGYLKLFPKFPSDTISLLERQILDERSIRAVLLDAAGLRDLEPTLARSFSHALYLPDSGSVASPGGLLELYWKAFRERQGAVSVGEAHGISYGEDQIAVTVNGARIVAQRMVIAAGAWSPGLIAPLGYRIPFAAERGYHAQFKLRPGERLNRPVFDPDAGYAAAPIEDGVRVLTGIEIARPEDPPDFRQLCAVLGKARARLSLAETAMSPEWFGSRPATADGLPVIGEAVRHRGLFFAFGHGHIGFSTGPATGHIIADLMTQTQPEIQIAPFAIERFS
jgi:D-amino-acid dehydrogenase